MLQILDDVKTAAKNLLESRHWPDRPQTVNFEITAACDARCIHCPRLDMDRPMKAMGMDMYHRLIDQSAELGVPYLCPNGYGEICTIPLQKLEEYFDYIAMSNRRFKIIVNTNGHRMFEDRCTLFIEHQVHLVNVTIDGATAATAESIRVNLSFDQIEANINNLLRMRKSAKSRLPKVRVGMIAMPQTIPEAKQFLDRWQGVADYVGIGGYSSRLASVAQVGPEPELVQLSSVDKPKVDSTGKPPACILPFRDLNIWADGKAVLCCEDWNEEYVVGDLNTQSLREIWHGPRMTEVRNKHIANSGHDVSLCAKCTAWVRPSVGTRMWV